MRQDQPGPRGKISPVGLHRRRRQPLDRHALQEENRLSGSHRWIFIVAHGRSGPLQSKYMCLLDLPDLCHWKPKPSASSVTAVP